MDYEYMALPPEDGAYAGQCRAAVRNKELADKGWKNWAMIPWYESGGTSVCVVRREVQAKDEPRMWTEGEIEEIAKRYYWRRAEEAKIHAHIGSDPMCLCEKCSTLYRPEKKAIPKEEINA